MSIFKNGLGALTLGTALTAALGGLAGERHAIGDRLGANKFDLMLQFTGRASGGDGSLAYRQVDRAMALKAMADARDEGFGFLRVAVSGFGPSWPDDPLHNDLALWIAHPDQYWADADAMFDALDRLNMKIVPSLLWNIQQFPALNHETVADFIANPRSRSRQMAQTYVSQFVTRYRGRKSILFYEMGNEYNLLADLDQVRRCTTQAAPANQRCASAGNFTTAQLDDFGRDMAGLFHALDPSRGVSSGYSAPRPSALHLAARPEFSPAGPDWTPDTASELSQYLVQTHGPFDVVSLHVYPDLSSGKPTAHADRDLQAARLAARLLHPLGKTIFIGEFGDRSGSALTPGIAQGLRDGAFDRAAVWVWEFRQFRTDQDFDPAGQDYEVEPGHGDQPLRAALHTPQKPSAPIRVVLTWPLPCARIDQPVNLSAEASIGAASARRVEFRANGRLIGQSIAAPFHASFDPRPYAHQTVRIEARAFAKDGRSAISGHNISVGPQPPACRLDP